MRNYGAKGEKLLKRELESRKMVQEISLRKGFLRLNATGAALTMRRKTQQFW